MSGKICPGCCPWMQGLLRKPGRKTPGGMSWKAGVAAEVIGVVAGSLGERLYDAKIYLQTADLLAWTAVIVALSALFERLVLALLRRGFRRLERGCGT